MIALPKWKIWLSYLWDIHIETRSSEYNPILNIELSKGRFLLSTQNAVYSHEDKYENFGLIFNQTLDINPLALNKVLVLGLGLGSIPILLDLMAPGAWDITAVEIDEEVVALAHDYAYQKIQSNINTIIADASIYIQTTRSESFDMICVDLFVGDQTPNEFQEIYFLEKLKNLLSPAGILIYNTLAYTAKHQQESTDFFNNAFKKVFPQAEKVYAHRNYMLINNKDWFGS